MAERVAVAMEFDFAFAPTGQPAVDFRQDSDDAIDGVAVAIAADAFEGAAMFEMKTH
jgi:hypothetical protein